MENLPGVFDGVVHGRTIQLTREPGLPDGQLVSVIVKPMEEIAGGAQTIEDLRRSFGGWADDAEGLDEFLQLIREQRAIRRQEEQP